MNPFLLPCLGSFLGEQDVSILVREPGKGRGTAQVATGGRGIPRKICPTQPPPCALPLGEELLGSSLRASAVVLPWREGTLQATSPVLATNPEVDCGLCLL